MFELAVLIISSFLNTLLGLVAYLKNTKGTTNRLFFGLTLSLVTWSGANYISVHPSIFSQLVWVRLVLFFAAILNLAVYLTFKVFPRYKFNHREIWTQIFIVYTIFVMGLTLSPLVFVSLTIKNGAAVPVPGPGIVLFLLQTVALLSAAAIGVFKRFRSSKGKEKEQFRYVLLGIIGSFSFIVLTDFIIVAFFKTTIFVPLGSAYTLILSGSIAYAIVRHRLLDIRAVVARSATYVLLLATLASLYGLLIFAVSHLLFASSQFDSHQQGLYIFLAILLAFTFQPLRRFFEHLTDRIFYRDRYVSQEVLNAVGKVMAEEIILENLLKECLGLICQAMRVEMGQFMIFDKDRIFKVEHYGPLPTKMMVAPTVAKLHVPLLVADELEGGQRKKILEEHNVRVSLMLRTKDTLVGFLFLGDKLSGDIYSTQDLQLLQILSQELSIAILNAKAYAEIAQFNVTLQQRISSATARLRVANKNLKALDSAKDEFISMASHQLRTPLTTIKGYISMMMEGDTGQINIQQQEFLGYAYEGAERMVALISDLLNVSRLSAGRFVIEKKPTDLVAVVADEVRQLRRHAEAKSLELQFIPPKRKLPLIDLDEGKTRQVIMNFIDNAIYYTKQGGVYITLTADKTTVRLTVRDTGIGVPESARDQLFTKFFRAENAQAARPDGTGLGLYLAKQVVVDQGGAIIFESKQDHGSTFGFSLPMRAASEKPRAKSQKPHSSQRVHLG